MSATLKACRLSVVMSWAAKAARLSTDYDPILATLSAKQLEAVAALASAIYGVSIPAARLRALLEAAEYIASCDNKEHDDYVTYCDDNEIDPKQLNGRAQRKHIYARALVGLNLTFPKE